MRVTPNGAAFLLLAAIGMSSPARADGCLQAFSCKLYGECKIPCLDGLTGEPAPAEPVASVPAAVATATADGRSSAPSSIEPRKVARRHVEPRAASRPLEVRVVAGKDVTSISQLAGKAVSFGPPGDTSQADVGRKIFKDLGIKVQEARLDIDNALDGVGSGDLGAVIVMRPRDRTKLKALSSANLHVLSIPAKRSTAAASPVPTVAVRRVASSN